MTNQASLFTSEPVVPDRVKPNFRTADILRRILAKQQLWAKRHAIPLQGSAGERGEKVYTYSLSENLFEPLLPSVEAQFRAADGHELGSPRRIGKVQALHSSSCLCMNTFHHWLRIGRLDLVAQAIRVPSVGIVGGGFEEKFMIDGRFGTSPNIDFVLRYGGNSPSIVAIECKYTEVFGREHGGFPAKYHAVPHIWDGLENTRRLAVEITGDVDPTYRLLHAKQLVCHVLGLMQAFGDKGRFRLHYLYYDAPGAELHRDELEHFSTYLDADGVSFSWSTYQDLIIRLSRDYWDIAPAWCAFMSSRYL